MLLLELRNQLVVERVELVGVRGVGVPERHRAGHFSVRRTDVCATAIAARRAAPYDRYRANQSDTSRRSNASLHRSFLSSSASSSTPIACWVRAPVISSRSETRGLYVAATIIDNPVML